MMRFAIPGEKMAVLLLAGLLLSCTKSPTPESSAPGNQGNSAPTSFTAALNNRLADDSFLLDPEDAEDARRGLIAEPQSLVITMSDGSVVWDRPTYDFITGPAPASVNPSLWRQAQLNNLTGLFEVTEGVYQIRGFDLANMTLIEGQRGWIVVDPLTTRETAAAALAFAFEHVEAKPVSAVILTHSHIDHFGGVTAVLESDGSTEIIAPVGFMAEATRENMLAGRTMGRRSMYMFGNQLERSPRGHVDSGLGKSPAQGSAGIATPTRIIANTGEQLQIDGVAFIFQNAENSEAPAELTFYLPEKKAFCGAELVSRTLHNLYTLRGAKVRDALSWSQHIDDALTLFGSADVYFGSHHWPLWGNAKVIDFLEKQRDSYRYIHDQTLRLASLGQSPAEIAEALEFPETLRTSASNRGYYGTLKHNAKAVYQRYFGWYDGNPAHLDPLPAVQSAPRYVTAMGGADAVVMLAQEAYDEGDYRWVAELLNHVVFAEPDHLAAKTLLAQSYDQLGYQAESGPWRDVYLTAALELRQGAPKRGIGFDNAEQLLRAVPIEEFMRVVATLVNGGRADGEVLTFNVIFTDVAQDYTLELYNAVLHSRSGTLADDPNATLRISHDLFIRLIVGKAGLRETLFSEDVSVEGSSIDLLRFFSLLDPADEVFAIVTP